MSVGICPVEIDLSKVLAHKYNTCWGQWSDYAFAAVLAWIYPIARFILDRTLFQAICGGMLGMHGAKLVKAKESFWKMLVYIFLVALALTATYNEPFFTNTKLYWDECTRLPCEKPTLPRIKLLYLFELAYYAQELPMLFIWFTKRKDFGQLVAHHIATLGLIIYSLELGLTCAGSIIFMLHDFNDPFLEAAKLARYAGHSDGGTIGFILFVISWFTTRIWLFPVRVIKSTLFESAARAAFIGISIEPHYSILNSLLIFLLVLHAYWSYLIVKIIVRQLTQGKLSDVREEDDVSDDEKED